MYAIVDIETTGGNPQNHRITEIAIYLFDGTNIIDEFVSLINPETYIPHYITQLTGITNEMVANAPRFCDIARKVVEITDGVFFVAHNAQFDYRFIQNEFKRLGYNYSRDTLCTVKLSRKNFPGYSSYSLGNLCQVIGIEINGRHRAAGDALATVALFKRLIEVNPEIEGKGLNTLDNLIQFAPKLNPERIMNIPESIGVYYFYNNQGDIIYIGKSINIRKRILDHLMRPTTKKASEMLAQISDVDYVLTGSELIALIAEADAIKTNLPKFNKRGRRKSSQVGLFSFTDQDGYVNIWVENISNTDEQPLSTFNSKEQAKEILYRIVEEYALCQKLCGLYSSSGSCFHHQIELCKGACIGEESPRSYNIRANAALQSLGLGSKSFLLIDEGRNLDEISFVKVINGKIEGYGYFNPEFIGQSLDLLYETIIPCGNHKEAVYAMRNYIAKSKTCRIIPIDLSVNSGY
jgi:DNA polymerase-3 subunit epsilon